MTRQLLPARDVSDIGATILVGLTWAITTGFALFTIFRFGRNMPVIEDWLMVSAVTGHEPAFWWTLWEQNAEHRVPLPRLVLHLLLVATHGDFRAGMYFNVLCAAAVAAMMVVGIRQVRGGRTDGIISRGLQGGSPEPPRSRRAAL